MFALFVVAVVIIGLTVELPGLTQIRAAISSSGWPGALAFCVLYGLITLTPIPKNVVSVAAGVVWGLALGSLLVYAGALLGATLAFLVGRSLGRDAVERFTGTRVDRVDAALRRHGLASVIGVRLIPVLPFTAINYAASLTAISVRDYAVGTAVGIIPGTVAYVAIGAYGFEPGAGLTIAVSVLGVLTVAGAILGLRMRRRQRLRPTTSDGSADA